jgi:hypothetical protein
MLLRVIKIDFNSRRPKWKDPKLEELFQQRMPKTCFSYLDTMQWILERTSVHSSYILAGSVSS